MGKLNKKLFQKIEQGKTQRVRELIDEGADVNARDEQLNTPLHIAVANEWVPVEIIDILIKKGADVNARDMWGRTPLHLAASETNWSRPEYIHCLEAAKLLVKNGADRKAEDKEGNTPLMLATEEDGGNIYAGHAHPEFDTETAMQSLLKGKRSFKSRASKQGARGRS